MEIYCSFYSTVPRRLPFPISPLHSLAYIYSDHVYLLGMEEKPRPKTSLGPTLAIVFAAITTSHDKELHKQYGIIVGRAVRNNV